MSEKNRIHVPGQIPEEKIQACNIGMTNFPGVIEMTFEPPITRMRLRPREARNLALALLGHADAAEYPATPPVPLQPPIPLQPPTDAPGS